MKLVGSVIAYFETPAPECFRDPCVRATLARGLVESAFPGLWGSLEKDGLLVARAGPFFPGRKGYAGIGLCSAHPDLFRLLTLALARSLFGKTCGEWGEARLVRIEANPERHPFVRMMDLDSPFEACPLREGVEIVSRSPVRPPFEFLQDLRAAAQDLAGLTGKAIFLPSGELPPWDFLRLETKACREQPGLLDVRLKIRGNHPCGKTILDFAVLKGFGQEKGSGYGHLDFISPKGEKR